MWSARWNLLTIIILLTSLSHIHTYTHTYICNVFKVCMIFLGFLNNSIFLVWHSFHPFSHKHLEIMIHETFLPIIIYKTCLFTLQFASYYVGNKIVTFIFWLFCWSKLSLNWAKRGVFIYTCSNSKLLIRVSLPVFSPPTLKTQMANLVVIIHS